MFAPRWFQQWNKVTNHVPWGKWSQPKNVPECVLLHLETFVWTYYEGEIEDEEEVAKYILRNTSSLRKEIFSKIQTNPKENVRMVEELESVVRASKSCQLMFK